MNSVIVFGATGTIGSIVAQTAAALGARVILPTRDMGKAVPVARSDLGYPNKFERVHADLSEPDTIRNAITSYGSKRAFLYLAFGSQDHMRAPLIAMKQAGIEFVVFLSSFTVRPEQAVRDVAPESRIAYAHAQVEANLDDIFGPDGYVAIRPGAFVTNLLKWKKDILAGEVRMFGNMFEQDNITPGDISRTADTILVSGPKSEQRKVNLYGPEIMSQQDSIIEIGRTLGREVVVTGLDDGEGLTQYMKSGMTKERAEYMVRLLGSKQFQSCADQLRSNVIAHTPKCISVNIPFQVVG